MNRIWSGSEGGGVQALARAFLRTDTMRPLLTQLATLPVYALFGESYGAAMTVQVMAYLICGIVAAFWAGSSSARQPRSSVLSR